MKRVRDLMNKTSWGWIVALGMVPLAITGCGPTTGTHESGEEKRTELDPWLYKDRATGCEYLTSRNEHSLTPRIAADGKTHMGCKAVQP